MLRLSADVENYMCSTVFSRVVNMRKHKKLTLILRS